MKKFANTLFIICVTALVLNAQKDSAVIVMDRLGKQDFIQVETTDASTVTSASRNKKNIEDLPFTAYVITKEVIAERGYQTLVDVLNDLPGVRVSQPGSAEHGETFSLRGLFGNYYSKILLDNVPIQPSATNGMPLEAQLPIQSVERIEVILGPASDVYGADAMAGVINIITQKSDKIKWGNASLIMGSPYLSGVNFTIGGKVGKANRVYRYSMFGGFQQKRNKNIVNGHADVYNPLNYSGEDSSFINSQFYQGTYNQPNFNGLPSESFYGGIRLSGKKLTLGFDANQRKEQSAIGLNPLFVTYHNPNHSIGESVFRGFAVYNTNIGNWNSRTYASWLSYRMNRGNSYSTVLNPIGTDGEFYMYSASDDLYLEETVNYGWANGLEFQSAVTFQYSGNFPIFKYLSTPFNPGNYKPWAKDINNSPTLTKLGYKPFNYSNTSGMAQVYYQRNKWEAMLGLRYDYNSQFGGSFNQRFGASYKIKENVIFRMSISSAFRPPSSYLIYSSYKSTIVGQDTLLLPSPQFNLQPEKLGSIEFGAKWILSKKAYFDFVAYNHVTQNHIVKTLSYKGTEVFYGYQNSTDSKSGLFGMQIQYALKDYGQKKWFTDASVTFSKGYEDLPFGQGRLNEYREMPRWIGKWLIGFHPVKDFSVSARSQFMSNWLSSTVFNVKLSDAYRVDSFYTLDILLNYLVSDNIKVFCNIFNVTDSHYGGISAVNDLGVVTKSGTVFTESLYYNPQYGARFTLGASIQF